MATARKTFTPRKPTDTDPMVYKAFMQDLLAGTVKAIKVIETKDGNGHLTKLEFDDPNG